MLNMMIYGDLVIYLNCAIEEDTVYIFEAVLYMYIPNTHVCHMLHTCTYM